MKMIEHDPDEFTDKRGNWWLAWSVLALVWAGNLYFFPIDLRSVALGLYTGCIIVAWAMDITGGKVPESWRTKPPGGPRT